MSWPAVVLGLVLVLAQPVFGKGDLPSYYFTYVTTTAGLAIKWINQTKRGRLDKPKSEAQWPEIPCDKLLGRKPTNPSLAGCTVWLSCEHEDSGDLDRYRCLVPRAGIYRRCNDEAIKDIPLCDEMFRTPTSKPKELGSRQIGRTVVTLGGKSMQAQLLWTKQSRKWLMSNIDQRIPEDLVECEALRRGPPGKLTVKNCQGLFQCRGGQGYIVCQIVTHGSSKSLHYCGSDEVRKLPLCTEDLKPGVFEYDAQISTDDGSSARARLQIQPDTSESVLYPEIPFEGTDYLLGCSKLPTKAVEREGDVTHCSGAISCMFDGSVDDFTATSYYCRISDAIPSAGHFSVSECQAQPLPGLMPCNLRNLQFTLDSPTC